MGREVRATPAISTMTGVAAVLVSVGLVAAVWLGWSWGSPADQWRVEHPAVVVDPGGAVTVPGWGAP